MKHERWTCIYILYFYNIPYIEGATRVGVKFIQTVLWDIERHNYYYLYRTIVLTISAKAVAAIHGDCFV